MENQIRALRIAQTDPLVFPTKILKVDTMWWAAEKMIRSVFEHMRTAVQSGHSMSKDWTAGIIVLQWLFKHGPEAKVICTAPTLKQVKEIMFGEIAKQFRSFQENSPWPVPHEALKTLKLEFGPDWYAIGITTKESGESFGKFMGFKSKNMLIVVSEAQNVADNIYDQMEGMLTSENSRVLELGNPIAPIGRFWEHCTQARFGYNVIKLSCFDSPNVKEGREVIPGVVSRKWVEEKRLIWGEDHPYWTGRVLGEFPQSGADCIIPIEWIMRVVRKKGKDDDDSDEQKWLSAYMAGEIMPDFDRTKVGGLDISKGGADETAHVVLTGPALTRLDAFHDVDINETVGWARGLAREERLVALAIDEGGLAGVSGFMEEEPIPGLEIVRIMFGWAVEDSIDFANLAAKMWWALRDAFQNYKKSGISIPDDPVLIGQLAARKFEMTSKGMKRIKLESKKSAKSRGEESPDRADALAMAWYARLRILFGTEPAPAFESESHRFEKEVSKATGNRSLQLQSEEVRY